MPNFEALARAHMAQQVREATTVQVALAGYWDRLIDPSDLSGSFGHFSVAGSQVIGAGRIRSEATAQTYYDGTRELAELGRSGVAVANQPINLARAQASLSAAARLDLAKYKIGRGIPAEIAIATAKAAVLSSAKRQTLNAGRNRLIGLSVKDPDMSGWARVSDGKPCAFCAMLCSRGPVYSAQTVAFVAHDGCGCSVMIVPRTDRSNGWTGDAKRYSSLWDALNGDPQLFRSAIYRVAQGMSDDEAAASALDLLKPKNPA